MPNGSALDSSRLNQFQQAMSAFAGRGATTTEICGARVNGLIQVPLGVVSKGFPNSFRLDKKSIAVPLWVPAGYDSLTMLFQVRLGALKSVPTSVAASGFVGSQITIEIVQGGAARLVQDITWQSVFLDPQGNGYFEMNVPLANIFNLSPIHADLIYIRLNYTAVEGHDDLLGQNTSGILNSPTFWQGISYFGAACYKSLDVC